MRRAIPVAAVAALLVVASVAAVLAGVVPLPDGTDVGDAPPTATGAGTPGDGPPGGGGGTAAPGDGSDATATPAAEFRIEVREIVECGTTCRDVTLALSNVGTASASGVSVRTELFAGNSTDSGDRIWEGTEDVGTLAAGGTYTTTRRVTLSFSEGFAVRQADGWVTVRTTIRTDEGSVTFVERRNVA